MLHIRVVDENGDEIGQRFLVVHKMQAGKRKKAYLPFLF
jgi:hypothetical protein